MTTPHTATHAPTIRQDLGALVATVAKFTVRADSLSGMGRDLQDKLSDILDQLKKEDADDHLFIREPAKDPATVKAEHASEPDGSRPWWVVYIGREPGLYNTIDAANAQIKGCPNQQYRRKGSKGEALLFYKLMYEDNAVENGSR
ncbi:hypothetical protein B0H10DRAFT_2221524 [Mycena sp. CBHHK59/15]|nr:hypothetical protein B0H10DRAFT_2221524 [Mycena sp. CBHHK59/15]